MPRLILVLVNPISCTNATGVVPLVEVELVVKAPAKAKNAVPMFSVKNLESPESKVFLDNVEVYILTAAAK